MSYIVNHELLAVIIACSEPQTHTCRVSKATKITWIWAQLIEIPWKWLCIHASCVWHVPGLGVLKTHATHMTRVPPTEPCSCTWVQSWPMGALYKLVVHMLLSENVNRIATNVVTRHTCSIFKLRAIYGFVTSLSTARSTFFCGVLYRC